MPIIDDKIVAASFESSKFEQGVGNTLSALDKLKEALKFHGAGKGLEEINSAAGRVNLGHIGQSIDDIKGRLGAFRLAAISIFANVASQAVSAGMRFARAWSVGPLIAGFQEYSTNLNAVQTILANTQASGATLKDVNSALLNLNKYSDKTIYNFSQMARNIGTFTAAGVDLKTSTASIKGIANLAALSGSNAEQASTAMYQLSQAISAGRVGLQDWNSVVNAGMGGTVFQRALAQTAERMGTIKEGALKLVGPMKNVSINGESFRQSMQAKPGQQSWLTSKVLTTTLQQFTGDLTDAQLKAQGFNDAQIKAIQQTAKTAQQAATQVKTISQVIDVARETAGSGWAQTWQIVFGDFGEAKTLFTNVSNAINGFINASSEARNKVLGDWKALGGRTILIDSIRIAFHNLGLILKPIKEAFRDIFPPTTGRDLLALTKRFHDFAVALKPSEETSDNLRRTFRGLFALLDIGRQVVSAIFGAFGSLFKAVGGGNGNFLSLTANIGDFLVALDKTLKKGDVFHKFFERLGDILQVPLAMLGKVTDAIGNLFSEFSPGGFTDKLSRITASLHPFEAALDAARSIWEKFTGSFDNSGHFFQTVLDSLVKFIQAIGPAIGQAASSINFEAVLAVIRTGLLAGLVVMLKNFFGKGSLVSQLGAAGGGFFSNISKSFELLQGSMKAMQQNVKADTLRKIAIAVALLTASIVALSFVDPERLKSSLTAVAVGFGILLGAMKIMEKIGNSAGFVKMPIISASMMMLAGAIDILAIAVIALSRLSWEELAKGLSATAALLVAISAASIPLSKNSAGMIRSGIGITAMAVGMKIMASAVKDFSGMNLRELGKGLGSVAAGLGIVAGAAKLMPKSMVITGAGLVIVAAGLKILAGVVERFGKMDLRTIGTGLVAIAGALVVVGAALKLMPATGVLSGAALILVAQGLETISGVVRKMGGMSIKQLGKGLVSLAGALVILAGALHLMTGTLGGAVALGIAATGLSLLVPVLIKLGRQSWTQILKGLAGLAGAIGVLAGAALLLAPAVPVLLGLGAALALVGAGMVGVGAGIALIGTGLSALAVAGPTGIAVLTAALVEFSKAIPDILKNVVVGLLEMVRAFAKTAPQFVAALSKILDMLLNVVIKSMPKIGDAFEALIKMVLKVLHDQGPKIIQSGIDIILWLLKGIRNNIGQIVSVAGDIVVQFLNSLSKQVGRIVSAGADVIANFVRGIGSNLAKIVTAGADMIITFVKAISDNLARVTAAGVGIITRFVETIAKNITNVIKSGTDLIVNFVKGIGEAGSRIVTAAVDSMTKFITTLAKQSVRMADEGAKAMIKFLNGMADVIEKREPELIKAGARIGEAIVIGMIKGLGDVFPAFLGALKDKILSAPHWAKKLLGIKSPSTVFYEIGQNIVHGLANGISDSGRAVQSASTLARKVYGAVVDTLKTDTPANVMMQIGKYMGTSFKAGMLSSADDIHSAFDEMDQTITDAMKAAQDKYKEENDKLTEMQRAKNIDPEALRLQTKAVFAQLDLVERLRHGHSLLVTQFGAEEAQLVTLSKRYDDITTRLNKAKDALAQAKQTREDAIKGFTSQYSTLPDIVTKDSEGNAVDQLNTYMDALRNQAAAVGAYKSTLDQLRKLGLDDATYQKLLTEGTADQEFANQLLAGGRTAVKSLNTLDAQLTSVSKTLAVNAANNLYQAGIDAAQGLVNGLNEKRSKIRQTMEDIAREILVALKKELKIKSPSEAFAEIGRYSMEGMAAGFNRASGVVTDAVHGAGKDALASMRATMRNISGIVTDELNPSPVITPVLDLTQVKSRVPELESLTAIGPISASAVQASAISAEQTQRTEETAASSAAQFHFEQNNYSPEALSEVEIYRQTRNQLSQLKSALALT